MGSVWDACVKARIRHGSSPALPKVIKSAFRLLRYGAWGVLPTDKDSGFAICHKLRLHMAFFSSLRNPSWYRKLDVPCRDTHAQDVCNEYLEMCKHICSIGRDDIDNDLLKALASSSSDAGAIRFRVSATAKTHKAQGNCTIRLLHCMRPRCPFAPAMRYVSHLLRQHLVQIPHLVKDSFQFLRALRHKSFTRHASIVKIDIKEYYMSGSHEMLIHQSSRFFQGHQKHMYVAALTFILENQFVEVPGFDILWQVVSGSGMGMICSGEVSDAAFYFPAESSHLSNRSFVESVGLVAYFRFKDDIIAFLDGPNNNPDLFFATLSRESSPFTLELESVAPSEVAFLDVFLSKRPETSKFSYWVHEKRTSQWTPLGEDSLHAPSVHRAWPVAMARRFFRLCSSPSLAQQHVSRFVGRLRAAGASSPILHAVAQARHPTINTPRDKLGDAIYLVVPFFRQWQQAGLPRVLRRLNMRWSGATGLELHLSWRLGDSHLVQKLSALNRDYCFEYEDFCPITGGWLG